MSAPQKFSSTTLYAWLSGAWVDLTADWQQTVDTKAEWGINGYKATDLLADTGSFSFTLSNRTGKYYPDGPSALAGWGRFAPVKLELGFLWQTYCYRFYVDRISFQIGLTDNEAFVDVSCVDWLSFAANRPILAPNIRTNVTAADGMTDLIEAMTTQPKDWDFMTGDNIFKSIFDNIGMRTTAYAEFSKLANSEWGYCYLIKDQANGEKLVFENNGHRSASHPVGETGLISLDPITYKHLREDGGYHLREDGGKVLLEQAYGFTTVPILIEPETGTPDDYSIYIDGTDEPDLLYGDNIVNRMTVEAVPKKVDVEPVVLYNLGKPIYVKAGDTIPDFRARYTDPSGGSRVNAVVSSMLDPEEPGAVDPYLKTLLHFTDDTTGTATVVDSTGKHTWTAHDPNMWINDVYANGVGTQYVGNAIVGPYFIFGGYSDYSISTPSHLDFNFSSVGANGAFTIGWKEVRIDQKAGDATMTRDISKKYPPLLLGMSDGTDLKIYMSSNNLSWDIANGKSMGKINRGKWVDYEISRDEDGWFYAFADGQLTDKWYSALALPGGGEWNIGKIKDTSGAIKYTYMALDEFFVKKQQCLHKTNFTPLTIERKTTLDGDWLANTASGGLGTDISADFQLDGTNVTYGTEAVTYSGIKNNSASNGFLIFLQARGKGVYSYNPIEDSAEDTTSQQTYDYQTLSIRQPYQDNPEAGMLKAAEVVAREKDPHTDLQGISFVGNLSIGNMSLFLQADIGTLLPISLPSVGINGYYYINNKSFTLSEGGILRYRFGLREDFLHYASEDIFDENFVEPWTYTWAITTPGMNSEYNTGTVQNPGNALLTFGTVVPAYFSYGSGAADFTWADVETVTFTASLPSASVYEFFIGLMKNGFVVKVGFIFAVTAGGGAFIKTVSATGCDATPANVWETVISTSAFSTGYFTFTIRRISETSAAFSFNGGTETIVTDALPDDADVIYPVVGFTAGASATRTALIDRIVVTKRL